MAGRRGGVERVLSKLNSSIENKNYYEAHQMYRTLFFRYMGQKKYTELETMLYDGACLLYSHSQVESGLDLSKLYLDLLNQGEIKPEDDIFQKIARLYELIPCDNVDKPGFLSAALKWSSLETGANVGHPRLHQYIAYSLWQKRKYSEARNHFLHSCDGEGCGSMLVEFHTTKGFNSETELFITQTVLQYLCLKKHIVAAVAFRTYTTVHPRIKTDPPYSNPLLNFIWFLLLAIRTSSSVSAYTVLCEKYKQFIDRDPQYLEYLDRIGQIFFGVPPPEKPSGMFSGLFNSLLKTMAEDSSDDECPGPSSSVTVAPKKKLEAEDLD
ncbi:Golgi to ER traffic protein 4 homolog [Eurytemora carolleeae]|uniref:Golgi to ER traffic protein 4 homolog n=1 Tax=Eurytemora carolleeae TaxID=1294199 RepID=UPI000C7742A4|nr:Golgi to ER traffic protein 4 homolog [Eurytemora carolleeae]|eukprot:XP_023323568.1 Golgi to ER traffic protein 4 homolog [Eurytemora affinis]